MLLRTSFLVRWLLFEHPLYFFDVIDSLFCPITCVVALLIDLEYSAALFPGLCGRDVHNMNELQMKELLVSNEKIKDRGVLYIQSFPHSSTSF